MESQADRRSRIGGKTEREGKAIAVQLSAQLTRTPVQLAGHAASSAAALLLSSPPLRRRRTANAPSVPCTCGNMSRYPSGLRQWAGIPASAGGGSTAKSGWLARKAATCCWFSDASRLQVE